MYFLGRFVGNSRRSPKRLPPAAVPLRLDVEASNDRDRFHHRHPHLRQAVPGTRRRAGTAKATRRHLPLRVFSRRSIHQRWNSSPPTKASTSPQAFMVTRVELWNVEKRQLATVRTTTPTECVWAPTFSPLLSRTAGKKGTNPARLDLIQLRREKHQPNTNYSLPRHMLGIEKSRIRSGASPLRRPYFPLSMSTSPPDLSGYDVTEALRESLYTDPVAQPAKDSTPVSSDPVSSSEAVEGSARTGAVRSRTQRWVYLTLGSMSLALGFLGIMLPLLPTTPLVLLAAFCFARGSERAHRWLLQNRIFGPIVRDWEQHRCVPVRAKWTGIALVVAAFAISFVSLPNCIYGYSTLAVVGSIVVIFIATLPTSPRPKGA